MLDTCALHHAKGVATPDGGPLGVLDVRSQNGLQLRTTTVIRNCELLEMSYGEWLADLEKEGKVAFDRTTVTERKRIKNRLRNRMPTPGDRDVGAIALAARLQCPLLTHDEPAAFLADRCKVPRVDLFDLAQLSESAGLLGWPDIEALFAGFARFAWKPADWSGTVEATVSTRSRPRRVIDGLRDLLD